MQETYLQVRIHTQHVIALRFPKPAHHCAAETAFGCSNDDADIVAFALEPLNGLDGAVARIVVNDNNLDLLRGDGRVDLRERAEDARHERAQVSIFSESRDNDGVADVGHCRIGRDGCSGQGE